VVGILVAGGLTTGCGLEEGAQLVTAPGSSTPTAVISRPGIGFRSMQRLDEHFAKHGREFGPVSRDEYLRLAQALRDRAPGGPVLEVVRNDGTITRFDRGTGAFLAFASDGTIRTFFRPNDGEQYFQRQARR
jgi:pyocin large subunit-like protein